MLPKLTKLTKQLLVATTLMAVQIRQLMLDFTFGLIDNVHTCTCSLFRKS